MCFCRAIDAESVNTLYVSLRIRTMPKEKVAVVYGLFYNIYDTNSKQSKKG